MAVTRLSRVVLRELTPSEAAFQAWVLGLARPLGWRAYHTRFSKGSDAGFVDLCLVRPPRLILAELKVWPRLRLRPEQAAWLADLDAVPGVEAYVWRWVWPGDIEQEIAEVLAR